jgi:hypothetical protein
MLATGLVEVNGFTNEMTGIYSFANFYKEWSWVREATPEELRHQGALKSKRKSGNAT